MEAGKYFERGGSNGKVAEVQSGRERFAWGMRGADPAEKGSLVSEREHCVGVGYYYERELVIVRRRDYY